MQKVWRWALRVVTEEVTAQGTEMVWRVVLRAAVAMVPLAVAWLAGLLVVWLVLWLVGSPVEFRELLLGRALPDAAESLEKQELP